MPRTPDERLKEARERREKRQAAMERAWTELVHELYRIEESLTTVHNRCARNHFPRSTVKAVAKAQRELTRAVRVVEDADLRPPPLKRRAKKGEQP